MDNNERNEHFKGFAELLLNDLKPDMTSLFIALGSPFPTLGTPPPSREEDIERAQRLLMRKIAQRAYDLAVHVIDALKPSIYTNTFTPDSQDEIFKSISDLTEWPKTALE